MSEWDPAIHKIKYWHRDYHWHMADKCKQEKKDLNVDSCPSYDNHGQWTLLTNCFCGGCGYSYINQLCNYDFNVQFVNYASHGATWYTFTHETGHMLGAHHTDDGIMYPYTPHDGIANGAIQFMRDDNEWQMCYGLLHALRRTDSDPAYKGVNGCFSVKDDGMIAYRWKSSGVYNECFPSCGKWRFKQLRASFLFACKRHHGLCVSQRTVGMCPKRHGGEYRGCGFELLFRIE